MKGIKIQILELGIIGTAIALSTSSFLGFLVVIDLFLITVGLFVK